MTDSMQQLLVEYPKCFIVSADNVGSKQMQRIRIALRGCAGICLNGFMLVFIVLYQFSSVNNINLYIKVLSVDV